MSRVGKKITKKGHTTTTAVFKNNRGCMSNACGFYYKCGGKFNFLPFRYQFGAFFLPFGYQFGAFFLSFGYQFGVFFPIGL